MGVHSISCLFKSVESDTLWVFSGVYGPCSDMSRKDLWEELSVVNQR